MSFDITLFDNAAMGIFKAKHPDIPVLHSDVWDEVLAQFKVNDLNPDGAVGELNRFSEWIVNWKLNVHTAMIDRIVITLSVPMGGGFLNVELQAAFPITFGDEGGVETEATPKMINDTAVKLGRQVMQTFTHMQTYGIALKASDMRPNDNGKGAMTPPPPTQITQAQNNREIGSVETVTAAQLVVGSSDGKTTYRIKAAWFMPYGAPVYEETFKAAGIDIAQYPIGVHPFTRTVDVMRVTDKKIKIIKIY